MQNLMPTHNFTPNAKPYSKRKTFFQRKILLQTQNSTPNANLIRNAKPYAKRKTLFETQNLMRSETLFQT